RCHGCAGQSCSRDQARRTGAHPKYFRPLPGNGPTLCARQLSAALDSLDLGQRGVSRDFMILTAETLVLANHQLVPDQSDLGSDRRADVDAKQAWVAALLNEVGCEGLLILEPENFAWLTSGATARGVLEPDEMPALYFN